MGKPRMIILIRHAQSEGNKNREVHQTIPDHQVHLTQEGHRQALEAGTRLRGLLRPDDTIHFFTSPYRRTRETTEGILQSLAADTPSPSPFPRHTIKVYEEPRLREQDFGNFQPCSAEMERMWLERADYGHFFYRIPNGESAADAYDRVSGFNESMWRLFGEQDFASVSVLVTHGLMTRIFLMKWYHWSVEYFEDLRNIDHCEFVIMKLNEDNGKYVLQNQLRTWSELKREKEHERQRERAVKGPGGALNANALETPVPIRRKWGGCPDGCDHSVHRKGSLRSSRTHSGDQRNDHNSHHHKAAKDAASHSHTSQEKNIPHHHSASPTGVVHTVNEVQTLVTPEPALGDRSGDEMPLKALPSNPQYPSTSDEPSQRDTSIKHQHNHPPHHHSTLENSTIPPPKRLAHRKSEDRLLQPLHPNYSLIHLVGRDGGGTLSGANSLAPSEDEHDHHPHHPHHHHYHEPKEHENTRASLKRHKTRPSHDLANDGDDEGSGRQTPKIRRTRSHNRHNHLPATPSRKTTTILRKGIPSTDDNTLVEQSQDTHSESASETENKEQGRCECGAEYGDEDEGEGEDGDTDTLEQAMKEDQSLRGSVY
ncbi:histidine phosphatase superfamily [Aspergillus cavernicola]|uniref:Histidine phosphatase superfamily n=1 Tax=Aspergillus cavernicola TaxID=176166 RepID=A0ABR4IGZ5_9EURO